MVPTLVQADLLRWDRAPDRADRVLLDQCRGAVVDLGCGPGRMTEALHRRGHRVLGVDLDVWCVERLRGRGLDAVGADALAPLPGEGTWDTALLADGNVGLGGDPCRLLLRLRGLLSWAGRVVLDLPAHPVGVGGTQLAVHAPDGVLVVPWALVGADGVAHLAARTGYAVSSGGPLPERAGEEPRRFVVLEVCR